MIRGDLTGREHGVYLENTSCFRWRSSPREGLKKHNIAVLRAVQARKHEGRADAMEAIVG